MLLLLLLILLRQKTERYESETSSNYLASEVSSVSILWYSSGILLCVPQVLRHSYKL